MEIKSDNTISSVDTFSMQRCQEFLDNRRIDLDRSIDGIAADVERLLGAWSGKHSQVLADAYADCGRRLEQRRDDVKKCHDILKDAIQRHGTAAKRAESIAASVEKPVWPDEII